MEATVILAMAEAALTLLEKAAPAIEQAVEQGQITPDQQQALHLRVQALRTGGRAFQGTEWQTAGS